MNSDNTTDNLDDYFLLWGVPTNIKNRQTLKAVRYILATTVPKSVFGALVTNYVQTSPSLHVHHVHG